MKRETTQDVRNMVKEVSGFQATDGSVHPNVQAANKHQAKLDFEVIVSNHLDSDDVSPQDLIHFFVKHPVAFELLSVILEQDDA